MNSIAEAKIFLRANFDDGVGCPCCGQFVKRYKRNITSTMAYGLIILYRDHKVGDLVHVETFLFEKSAITGSRGNIALAKYWGLLNPVTDKRDDGSKRNGYYYLTEKGRKFVAGEISVQKYVYMFNDKFLGYFGDEIKIVDALGAKFSYAELMKS